MKNVFNSVRIVDYLRVDYAILLFLSSQEFLCPYGIEFRDLIVKQHVDVSMRIKVLSDYTT